MVQARTPTEQEQLGPATFAEALLTALLAPRPVAFDGPNVPEALDDLEVAATAGDPSAQRVLNYWHHGTKGAAMTTTARQACDRCFHLVSVHQPGLGCLAQGCECREVRVPNPFVANAAAIVNGAAAEADAAPAWWRGYGDFDPSEEYATPPAALACSDGTAVILEGRRTWISGQPGTGKSWIALMAAAAACARGSRAVYIDAEMTYRDLGQRLAILPDQAAAMGGLLRRVDGIEARTHVGEIVQWLRGGSAPGLVALDSARSLGAPADGSDVEGWIADYVTPYRLAGFTVIVIDHVPKRDSERAPGAIGSQAKLAEADVSLRTSGQAWSRQNDGRVRLILEKDRHGELNVPAQHVVATARGWWRDDGTFSLAVHAPDHEDAATVAQAGHDEDLLDAVRSALWAAGEHGIVGRRAMRLAIEFKAGNTRKDEAVAALVEVGEVIYEPDAKGARYILAERLESTDGDAF